jgi:hypothetical protein
VWWMDDKWMDGERMNELWTFCNEKDMRGTGYVGPM